MNLKLAMTIPKNKWKRFKPRPTLKEFHGVFAASPCCRALRAVAPTAISVRTRCQPGAPGMKCATRL